LKDGNVVTEKKRFEYKCSGAVYDGECFGGFRHGKGTMKWTDLATFEGTWSLG
jgi:hypothetical protein